MISVETWWECHIAYVSLILVSGMSVVNDVTTVATVGVQKILSVEAAMPVAF